MDLKLNFFLYFQNQKQNVKMLMNANIMERDDADLVIGLKENVKFFVELVIG